MTIAVSYVFEDGIAMLSDSRAVWNKTIPEDALQKIIFLTNDMVIGYSCEDLKVVNKIIKDLKNKIARDEKFNNPYMLSCYLSRVSKHYYQKSKEFSFILSGIAGKSKVESWAIEFPDFKIKKLEKGFKIIGTGKLILDYLLKNKEKIEDMSLNLKERADILFIGIAGALDKIKIKSVGGFFQIILITIKGISPLEYGYIDINPLGSEDSKKIEWKDGTWIQKDYKKGHEVSLVSPEQLISKGPASIKFHDYIIDGRKSKPQWYLSHLMTCNLVNLGIGYTEFIGVFSQVGFYKYPISFKTLVAVRFWGPGGKHKISLRLKNNNMESILYEDLIETKVLPNETDLITKVTFKIDEPGLAFLECYVDNNLIGRRSLYFGKTINVQLCGGNLNSFYESNTKLLKENHRSCVDNEIVEKGKVFFDYYAICEQAEINNKLIFKNQFFAAFWENFPLDLKMSIVCGIRMSKGRHNISIFFVDAISGKKTKISNSVTESSSSCFTVPHLFKNLIFRLENPSLYYINLYLDDKMVCSKILSAETSMPKFSINPLFPTQIDQVKKGELLLLLNRPFSEIE